MSRYSNIRTVKTESGIKYIKKEQGNISSRSRFANCYKTSDFGKPYNRIRSTVFAA